MLRRLVPPPRAGLLMFESTMLDSDSIDEDAIDFGTDPLIGVEVGNRYRIDSVLGAGGMGVVYAATQVEIERAVAIKVMRIVEPTALERFRREAVTIGKLGHPNIIDLYDVGRLADGRPYMVMPRIEGENLGEILENDRRLSPIEVAELLAGPASALDAMHKRGFVHRDIKPENLMIERRDDTQPRVLLLDFGLAQMTEAGAKNRLTREGIVAGTPHYMSPETAFGQQATPRSDVYSLAAVAFELMVGEAPFDDDNPVQVLVLKVHSEPPTLRSRGVHVNDAIEEVMAAGLAREPENRYPTAGAFVEALRVASERRGVADAVTDPARAPDPSDTPLEGSEPPPPPPALERAPSSMSSPRIAGLNRPRRGVVAAMVIAALAVIALLAWMGWRSSSRVDTPPEPPQPIATGPSVDEPVAADEEEPAVASPAPEPPAPAPPPLPTTPVRATEADTTLVASTPAAGRRRHADAEATHAAPSTAPTPGSTAAAPPREAGAAGAPDPDRELARARTEEGTRALMAGLLPRAVDRFRAATLAAPHYAPAWRGLGLANERMSRGAEARRAYTRYLALAPSASDAAAIRARLGELGTPATGTEP
ncbi:MAG: protein kinase [Sandaracinaceae bacterium]